MDWRLKDREPGSTNFLVSSTLTKSKIGWGGGSGGGGAAHGRPQQHLEKFPRVEQQKSEIAYPGASNSNNRLRHGVLTSGLFYVRAPFQTPKRNGPLRL